MEGFRRSANSAKGRIGLMGAAVSHFANRMSDDIPHRAKHMMWMAAKRYAQEIERMAGALIDEITANATEQPDGDIELAGRQIADIEEAAVRARGALRLPQNRIPGVYYNLEIPIARQMQVECAGGESAELADIVEGPAEWASETLVRAMVQCLLGEEEDAMRTTLGEHGAQLDEIEGVVKGELPIPGEWSK
ncbi:MAG: hypothetical protein LBR78_00225 [Holosporales bacterium]|nr:hypothetical protein [Holosporales bacterium]